MKKLAKQWDRVSPNFYRLKCGNCEHIFLSNVMHPNEVERINLSDTSAELTIESDCPECKATNQFKMIVSDEDEKRREI
jgi:rubredoxin